MFIQIKRKGNRHTVTKRFNCPIKAAKAVDLYLIKKGEEPVNIYKRK